MPGQIRPLDFFASLEFLELRMVAYDGGADVSRLRRLVARALSVIAR